MTETKPENPVPSGVPEFKFPSAFHEEHKGLLATALQIFGELDAGPVTGTEREAITRVLGADRAGGLESTLTTRVAASAKTRLVFSGQQVVKYDGTQGTTSLEVAHGATRAVATGFAAAVDFPKKVNPLGPDERTAAEYVIKVTALAPKYPAQFSWKPDLGEWLDTLFHELTVHGETYLDAIAVFRGGAGWPVTFQSTEHWLFIMGGVPRYSLLLARLAGSRYAELTGSFVKSLTTWAQGQQEVPPSVKNTLDGGPSMANLRELALLLRLPQPVNPDDEDHLTPNKNLVAELQKRLTPLAERRPLWWLP